MKKEKLYGCAYEKVHGKEPYYMILEYYLTEDSIAEQYCDLKRYGIIIKKTTVDMDGMKTSEKKEINDIFFHLAEAEKFIASLIKNKITPVAFRAVVEDYIEYSFCSRRQSATA